MSANLDASLEFCTADHHRPSAHEKSSCILDYDAYRNDTGQSNHPPNTLSAMSADELADIIDSLLWDVQAVNFTPASHIENHNYDAVRRPRDPLSPPPKPFMRKRASA